VFQLSERRKRIYFDQTQNERGRLDSTYSELGTLLRDNDYDVEPYTEFMILDKKIAEASVVVFGCPNSSKLRGPEIEALTKYVKQGGGLMFLSLSSGDRGLMNNMSKLTEIFGVTFENTAVKDDRSNSGIPTMVLIRSLEKHAVTTGLKELLYPSGCTLKVTQKAKVIASTSTTSEPASQPIIAISEFGKGRVMCIGSYEIFRKGGGLASKENQKFVVNAFRWLSGDTRSAGKTSLQKPNEGGREDTGFEGVSSQEMETTLRRLTNAVFDLQKDISKVNEKLSNVDKNIESLRNQFQDFAEKTQDQLGVMIPAKQFWTEEENIEADLEADIKALEKEIKSVEQLRDHIGQRHSSGAMPKEAYDEQSKKLESRIKSLQSKLETKKEELKELF